MFRGLLFLKPRGFLFMWGSSSVSVQFVVNSEDGSREKQELRNDGAVTCSDFMIVADGQRYECKDDSCDEAAEGNKVLECTVAWYESLAYVCHSLLKKCCADFDLGVL